MRFKLVKELNEDVLLEKWFEISVNNHKYYIYAKNASYAREWIDNAEGKIKRTHDPINKSVLSKCLTDVANNDYVYNCIQVDSIPHGAMVITAGNSSFRGKSGAHVDPCVLDMIKKDDYSVDTLYIHHINKQEYDQAPENLVAIPQDNLNRETIEVLHDILHLAGRAATITGTRDAFIKAPYYVSIKGTPVRHYIEIAIK